ncbi:hypothetical protein OKW76_13320 [Sphingomonas sp. S1-29]|uniref:hypothetical protein n=1 Tax=Sphingomonas sp. S1-29 TaxID=2991074 RepID=UPI00223EF845|nr:hypothetical protein [Sphingomonas sp. S1-29]UZK68993.1 hypothetical protein OKW76_13320 [Sphingomonas sp. S1-29]
MFAYRVSGLSVSSDLALPGLIAGDPGEPADIVIREGDVPAALPGSIAAGPNWQMADERFLLAVPGIVRMAISARREIRYALDGGDARDAAPFVGGTGFGILLHQRGRIVLHASAVRVGDGAALFCGPSGAGKSTLAAGLVGAGHALLADDFCAITIDPDRGAMVHPDGRQLKLWDNAIASLSLEAQRADPVRAKLRKFHVEPHAAVTAPLPVRAVYVLREARPPQLAGIVQPNIVDGAMLVRRNAYRPSLVERMRQQDLYFRAAALLAGARPGGVFTLTRRMDFADFTDVLDSLKAHWRTICLAGSAG